MKILVTGANGFLGSHVSRALAQRGHKVRGMILPGTPPGEAARWREATVEADLRDGAALARALVGVEAVAHLAACVADSGPTHPLYEINVLGTKRLLAAAARAGVGRLALVSSLTVHGFHAFHDAGEGTGYDWQVNGYARSKILAEGLCREAQARGLLETTILRPAFIPYGEHDRLGLPGMLAALESGFFPLIGGADPLVITVYADTFGLGLGLALERPEAAGEDFVIGDDEEGQEPWTFTDFLRALAEAAGLQAPRFIPIPAAAARGLSALVEDWWYRLGAKGLAPLSRYRAKVATHDLHFSTEKARRVLGFEPEVAREEAIRRSVDLLRK